MALTDTRGQAGAAGRLTPERRRAVEQRRGINQGAASAPPPAAQSMQGAPPSQPYSPGQYARANPVSTEGVNPALFNRTPEHQAAYDRVLSGRAADRMSDYESQQEQGYRNAVAAGAQSRYAAGVEGLLAGRRGRPQEVSGYEAPALGGTPQQSPLSPAPPYVPIGNEYSREYLLPQAAQQYRLPGQPGDDLMWAPPHGVWPGTQMGQPLPQHITTTPPRLQRPRIRGQ